MIQKWMNTWENILTHKIDLRRAIAGSTFQLWMQRIFGDLNFHMTQITNHGCFRSFLYRIKRADSMVCLQCSKGIDTAEHALFDCATWDTDYK